jgi:2-polyprenyl-6-methoxyphenol hydroxylase-like FAD-dependent oxidoreductase
VLKELADMPIGVSALRNDGSLCAAGELLYANGDYRQVFEAYEARLRSFVDDKQNGARGFVSVFATKTRLGIGFRNLVMRTMDALPRSAELVMARSFTDDFVQPDYPM